VERRVVNPWTWQDQYAFVQANEIQNPAAMLICSGQTATDESGNPMFRGDMRAQIDRALDNLETVLSAAGYSLADVVRLNYFTTDVDGFLEVIDALTTRLSAAGCQATSTMLGVERLASPDYLVEFEAVAIR